MASIMTPVFLPARFSFCIYVAAAAVVVLFSFSPFFLGEAPFPRGDGR